MTPYQLAATIRRLSVVGGPIRLKSHDTVERLDMTDTSVTVLIRTYRVRDLDRETRVTHEGVRLLVLVPDGPANLIWKVSIDQTTLVELDQPAVLLRFQAGRQEFHRVAEAALDADMCYRPGTGSWCTGKTYLGEMDNIHKGDWYS